jgi:hypothetical protein
MNYNAHDLGHFIATLLQSPRGGYLVASETIAPAQLLVSYERLFRSTCAMQAEIAKGDKRTEAYDGALQLAGITPYEARVLEVMWWLDGRARSAGEISQELGGREFRALLEEQERIFRKITGSDAARAKLQEIVQSGSSSSYRLPGSPSFDGDYEPGMASVTPAAHLQDTRGLDYPNAAGIE